MRDVKALSLKAVLFICIPIAQEDLLVLDFTHRFIHLNTFQRTGTSSRSIINISPHSSYEHIPCLPSSQFLPATGNQARHL